MAGTTPNPVTLPRWITFGQVLVGIGAILIFIGFIFGALATSNLATSATNLGNASNYQADLEAFFVITGFGILIAFAGWGVHSVWPKLRAQSRAAPAYPAPTAPTPPPADTTVPPPPPAAAPAAPTCPKCGKPTTFIAQYARYYCYTDNLYV